MDPNDVLSTALSSLQNGWNNASGTQFAEPFADNCEFVDIRGVLHRNATSESLAAAHQQLFDSIYKDSTIVYSPVQSIRIDSQTILANAGTELNAPSGPLAGKNASTITLVFTRTGDTWKIRAFHNTLVMNR